MAGKAIKGRMGMTKAAKRASRLAGMQGNRKRGKADARSSYHSEFKRNSGYPTQGKKGNHGMPPMNKKLLGFTG